MILKNKEDISEAIKENIEVISLNASKKIDAEFTGEIDKIINKLSEIYWVLYYITNYTSKDVDDIKLDSKILLWQGSNSLIGALQLIRMGYFFEPNFLERYAIENLSLALVLFQDYRKYESFKKGKLSGEKSITDAKKVISQIGLIYGILSQIIHPSKNQLGAYVVEERKTLIIGGGVVDEHMYRVKLNLGIIGFLSSVYLSGAELVFYDFLNDHKFWKKTSNNSFEWSPSQEEKDYGKMTKNFMKESLEELNLKMGSLEFENK